MNQKAPAMEALPDTDDVQSEAPLASPPRVLGRLYVGIVAMLIACDAYILWANLFDPGRVKAWLIHVRGFINAAL
jgi:hypothetical protein